VSPSPLADSTWVTDAQLGDSIACNGVCLTVVELTADGFSVDVSGETFSCTIGFAPGDKVNLEKAMRLIRPLGGHLVSGHVDGVGEVIHFAPVSAEATAELAARYSARRVPWALSGAERFGRGEWRIADGEQRAWRRFFHQPDSAHAGTDHAEGIERRAAG
jgi:hypothetical protein